MVPTGPVQAWQNDPFDALIDEHGMLCGRGAADMKGSLAAMLVAAERFVADYPDHKGSVAFLITSDEEGTVLEVELQAVLTQRNQRLPGH